MYYGTIISNMVRWIWCAIIFFFCRFVSLNLNIFYKIVLENGLGFSNSESKFLRVVLLRTYIVSSSLSSWWCLIDGCSYSSSIVELSCMPWPLGGWIVAHAGDRGDIFSTLTYAVGAFVQLACELWFIWWVLITQHRLLEHYTLLTPSSSIFYQMTLLSR